MAQMQGMVGYPPFFAGKQVACYEVGALSEKLNAIGVDDGEPVVDMTVDEEVAAAPRIKVKTLTGRVIDVDVEPTDPVGRIKERLQEEGGIPPQQQRLIFEGKQLADGKIVRESNVTAGSVIHLSLYEAVVVISSSCYS